MSESEDYNEFNSWDTGGAACMLALVPAVLYYVFSGHDKVGAGLMVVGACVVGLFALIVAHFFSSRVMSRLMQLIGVSLCVIYWLCAIHLLVTWDRFSSDPAPENGAESPNYEAQSTP